jgi:hypothetical protein
MNLAQKIFAGLGAIAIAVPAIAASAITYSGNTVYQFTQDGKTKIYFSGPANGTISYSYQPPTPVGATTAPAPKTKTVTLNACGFKAVTQSLTFPATFTVGSTSYTTASLTAAMGGPPVCRKSGTTYTGYVPLGWTP